MPAISPAITTVPLEYNGRVIKQLSTAQFALLAHALDVVTNRKGYVVRARLRPSAYLSSAGAHYIQDLGGGYWCHALTGTPGTEAREGV